MSFQVLFFDPATRIGMLHDTAHDLDRDYFYMFDASGSDAQDALADDVDRMLLPEVGDHPGVAVMVANAYRRGH